MKSIKFFVPGLAAPGGSKNASVVYNKSGMVMRNGRPLVAVRDSGKNNKTWRSVVALEAAKHQPITGVLNGPLIATFVFYMRRTGDHFGTGKKKFVLKADAPVYASKRPDGLKLVRAVEDALTGIIWRDDSQIVKEYWEKRYGSSPGVEITITELQ